VIVVYDITSRSTFDTLKSWLLEVEAHTFRDTESAPVILLVGNKRDRPAEFHAVTEKEAEEFAGENGVAYMETSALAASGVDAAFSYLAAAMCSKEAERYTGPPPAHVDLANGLWRHSTCCNT